MTDTTHEAPDRIKVWPTYDSDNNDWSSGFWTDTEETIGTTYVRADLVQAAVAAALREAINRVNGCDRISEVQPAILALITPDAQAALDRVVAAERERCINLAATWSKDAAATIREGGE